MKNQKVRNLLISLNGGTTFILNRKPAFLSNSSLLLHTLRDVSHVAEMGTYSLNRKIDYLMKVGSLSSAVKLFDEMSDRDAITWNIMIAGYYRNGFPRESLSLYNQMIFQGFVENPSTFSMMLSMCISAGFFRAGIIVHCRSIVHGCSVNVYIGSALVDLYFQMGLSDIALRLFSTLQERNLATWNIILRAFCEMGRSEELLRMYSEMKLEGLEPNGLTFCYMIRGCGCERFLDEGTQLHCCVIKKGLSVSNLFVANALVDFYSACGCLTETRKSFEVIPLMDIISWNSMISVCASNSYLCDALELYQRMHVCGKRPSVCSFLAFLKLSGSTMNAVLGKQIHCCILKLCFDTPLIQSALIDMYGKCEEIEISVGIFDSIAQRTLVCCNPLMASLLRAGLSHDVIELFGLMVDENIGYDEVSLSLTLKSLSVSPPSGSAGCSILHCCAIKSGFESDIAVACSLIDAYSKSGAINLSRQIFDQLPFPNVICYTSIITALARNGLGIECLELLNSMTESGLKPDQVTYLNVLMGCNHSGLVDEGRSIFKRMQTLHGLKPERQHYSCMIDLLGRSGLVDEAVELLKGTPWESDSVIWTSVLRSCKVHQNEDMGKKAAEKLVDLEPDSPSVWLQVSSFYSAIGDFEKMKHYREIAVSRKITREIGYSLIEVRGKPFDGSVHLRERDSKKQGSLVICSSCPS